MADEERRVEARIMAVGSGHATTPERIAELEERARRSTRLGEPKPKVAFAAVLDGQSKVLAPSTPKIDGREAKRQALPKGAPKPSLTHPQQRETYGRPINSEEPIILKG